MKPIYAVGVMSGTSLDGLDAICFRAVPKGDTYRLKVLAHLQKPYPKTWKDEVRRIAREDRLRDGVRFGAVWSEATGDLVKRLVRKSGLNPDQISAIGVHGQTVVHLPTPIRYLGRSVGITIQLGDLSRLAIRTGITVVGDFRPADIAAGGVGAPLVPHAHRILFSDPIRTIAVQNLGGIGNVTLLEKGRVHLAFDTGPANVWIDTVLAWKTMGKKSFDSEGRIARRGKPDRVLLKKLLSHPYFKRRPPKSAGWEEFGPDFLSRYRTTFEKLSLENALATVTWATAAATTSAYRRFVLPVSYPARLILAGGGAKNSLFVQLLREALPEIECVTSEEYGIGVDQLEALAFGLFAVETLRGRGINVPEATHASQSVISGHVAFGNRRPHIDRLRTLLLR